MSAVTFGDLVNLAGERLAIAETTTDDATDEALHHDLHKSVAILAGLAGDQLARRGIGPTIPVRSMSPGERALAEIHEALVNADRFLTLASANTRGPLADVTGTLAAARDLLATHHARTGNGELSDTSPWAPAIASTPVTQALATELARWSALLGPWARWLCRRGSGLPDEIRDNLAAASRCLRLAAHLHNAEPPSSEDRVLLLHGIPAATPPHRTAPADDELVPALCAGVASSAERLRLAAFTAKDHAAWSPSATARAWQYTARAAAIILDNAELALRTLTQAGHADISALDASARRLSTAQTAWRRIVIAWPDFTTDTSTVATRSNAEASDLVLRTGRLAFDNPHWRPTREHHQSPPRSAHLLAPDEATYRAVIGALHQAADALAIMAPADQTGVAAAQSAGRLYVATRTLDEPCDIPHPFATAPAQRAAQLLAAYQDATATTAATAHQLADLAIAVKAPSQVIALARKAADYLLVPHPTAAKLASRDTPNRAHSPRSPNRVPATSTGPRPADNAQNSRLGR